VALLGFCRVFLYGHGEIGSHVVKIIDVDGAGRSLGTPNGAEDFIGTGGEDMYLG
jgi:hypothetical protein